jgi:hypothetical protein
MFTTYKNGNLFVIVDRNMFVVKTNSCNFLCGYKALLIRLIDLKFFKIVE